VIHVHNARTVGGVVWGATRMAWSTVRNKNMAFYILPVFFQLLNIRPLFFCHVVGFFITIQQLYKVNKDKTNNSVNPTQGPENGNGPKVASTNCEIDDNWRGAPLILLPFGVVAEPFVSSAL